MGVLTIRRLDDGVIARLKARARQNGRSMEEEVRRTLADSAPERLSGQSAINHLKGLRSELFGDRILPDSTPSFRELRENDANVLHDE